jgi:hypothetical protein
LFISAKTILLFLEDVKEVSLKFRMIDSRNPVYFIWSHKFKTVKKIKKNVRNFISVPYSYEKESTYTHSEKKNTFCKKKQQHKKQ